MTNNQKEKDLNSVLSEIFYQCILFFAYVIGEALQLLKSHKCVLERESL